MFYFSPHMFTSARLRLHPPSVGLGCGLVEDHHSPLLSIQLEIDLPHAISVDLEQNEVKYSNKKSFMKAGILHAKAMVKNNTLSYSPDKVPFAICVIIEVIGIYICQWINVGLPRYQVLVS